MKQKNFLPGHLDDLAEKAIKIGSTASRFLTPAEAHRVTEHFSFRQDITLVLDGGYEGAERVRAIFLNPDRGNYEPINLFRALKVSAPHMELPGHRDLLGALMALGIERNVVGDIIESPLVFICLPELSGYIIENLKKAGRANLVITETNLESLQNRTENLIIKTDTVASTRLDSLISSSFNLSRGKAAKLIETGLVSLNHEICLRPDKEVIENSILSLRGFGRAKLIEIGGKSKKGRVFIKLGLYGRK